MLHHAPDYRLTYVPRAVYSRSRPRRVDCGPQLCSNRCQRREPLAPPGCSGHLQTAVGCPETPWRACHSSARSPATQFMSSMWFVSRWGIENDSSCNNSFYLLATTPVTSSSLQRPLTTNSSSHWSTYFFSHTDFFSSFFTESEWFCWNPNSNLVETSWKLTFLLLKH